MPSSSSEPTGGGVSTAPPLRGGTWDWDLAFLGRFSGPLLLAARVMLAYIFIVEGIGKIGGYAGVAGYMEAHGS